MAEPETAQQGHPMACGCEHAVRWHEVNGCGYFGWSHGVSKCGCVLTAEQVVEAVVARHVEAALLSHGLSPDPQPHDFDPCDPEEDDCPADTCRICGVLHGDHPKEAGRGE